MTLWHVTWLPCGSHMTLCSCTIGHLATTLCHITVVSPIVMSLSCHPFSHHCHVTVMLPIVTSLSCHLLSHHCHCHVTHVGRGYPHHRQGGGLPDVHRDLNLRPLCFRGNGSPHLGAAQCRSWLPEGVAPHEVPLGPCHTVHCVHLKPETIDSILINWPALSVLC